MAADDDHSIGAREPRHRLRQRFEVIRKLGHGTYGKVQLAINKETGQEVAIKTIKKAKIENGQDLVRIRREIQIMSYIQHPHIIHIHEVFENKEKIVLVMQYASGGELYDYLKTRRGASEADSRRIFRQIVSAVYYCHKNKICHRDLKLENILLDERGNAKIADFGLSNVFSDDKFLHTFCGSPLYASPEIVKGKPYYGPEVDCWSLGVLLYTLIYGAMPFDGSNFRSLVRQISEGDYYEPKRKSDASGLIQHLLTVKPAKRATVADICDHWWVNLGYEHPLSQVAEDMANFSPINIDAFLNLPQTNRNEQCKSPRKQDSRSEDSTISGQPNFSQETNECKAAKIVPKSNLNDRNYDVVNSDSVSCSDDSIVVNNIGPSKDTGTENNIFPSDCFHLVPDKNAVSKFGAKLSDKEFSRNNQDNIKHIPESRIVSTAGETQVVMKETVCSQSLCNPETLNKFSVNKDEVIHKKQRCIDDRITQDNSGKEKCDVTDTVEEKAFVQVSSQFTKTEPSEEKPSTSYKSIGQKNVQSLKKPTFSKDNSLLCSKNNKSPEVPESNTSSLKVAENSASVQVGKLKSGEEKLIHQSVTDDCIKAEDKEKGIDQGNTQNCEKTIVSKDNSLSNIDNNKPSEISQSNATTSKSFDNSISASVNKSEEKLKDSPAIKDEAKTENKSADKSKDPPDGKKSPCKKGPGKLVIPKFFEAAQTTEKPADNKKVSKPLWSISDAKKAFENKPQEKKPIYIPTRRVSDARSKFEQKIESNQVSTLPRRASRHNSTLKEDLSTSSLSSLKCDQRRGSELDNCSLKDASELDVQKPSCSKNSCEESSVHPEKKTEDETENSDNGQAKKTSIKPDINEMHIFEENKVSADNARTNLLTVSSFNEDNNTGSQNNRDISENEALETVTKVSSTSVDLESTPITQNCSSTIISSEQNSASEETNQVACQSENTFDVKEQQQQHNCSPNETTSSVTQMFPYDNREENESAQNNSSEHAQEIKLLRSGSATNKQQSHICDNKEVTSDDSPKEHLEENRINNSQVANDSGNCSDNEIRPPSKAQIINDQSSGYISESQSLVGGEEQDVNEGTKLDLLKTFMEQECFPLNSLLHNGYDHPHDIQQHTHQRPSFSNTVSLNNDVELGANNYIPMQTKKPHQSRRRHSDAHSFLRSPDNQTAFGLRDISDLPESCYDDMLRFLNSRDSIRNKCSTPSVLSKHRHSRHSGKDHQTRIQHWIKSEQRNGHSTDKDSSDNDDDFDIHLDYSYPVSIASDSYQTANAIEDRLLPNQYSAQLPNSRPSSHTGYRLIDDFTAAGSYKCSSLSNEEIENIIGIPSRNLNYIRRHSHTMRYKDPFLADITSRYIQNPIFQPQFAGYHHSTSTFREQMNARPSVAELYGTLRRRSCKSDVLELPEQRDGFYPSNSIARKSVHSQQSTTFRNTPSAERIRRNYARSLSLDIPDMPHHPVRMNCEINPQVHIPQDYTVDHIQKQNSDNLHLEEDITSCYPVSGNSSPSQNCHKINSEVSHQLSGETKINDDIMQSEVNKLESDIKDVCDSRKISDCVESLFKSEHSLLQQNMLTKPEGSVGSISDQDLSTYDRKHENSISLSSQNNQSALKASSLSLLEALKMQGYKNVIAQNLNYGSNVHLTSFDRYKSASEQESIQNLQNCKEQENFTEQKTANNSTKHSNDHSSLAFPINHEFLQHENLAFQQTSSKQQLATVQESNESLSCKIESDQEESVSERIWRKSFYSRFNDSHSKRRKSYREGDLKAQSISGSNWDILMEDNFKEDVLSRRRSSLNLGSSYSSTLPRPGIKPMAKQRSCGSEVPDPLLQINDSTMLHKSSYRQKCNKNNRSSSLEIVEGVSEDSSSFPIQRPTHSVASDRDLLYSTSIAESPYNRLYGTLKSAYCSSNRQMFSQLREGENCRPGTNLGGILPRRRYSTFDGYLYVQKTPTLSEPVSSVLDSTNAENDEFS